MELEGGPPIRCGVTARAAAAPSAVGKQTTHAALSSTAEVAASRWSVGSDRAVERSSGALDGSASTRLTAKLSR